MTQPGDLVLPRVAAGDARAAQQCVQRFGRLVWAMSRKYTHSDSDAEDASQDIFEDLFRSAGRFDPSRSTESGFVAMIARRRLIDSARRDSLRAVADPPDTDTQASREPGADERLDASRVAAAVQALPADERDVLLMNVAEGLTHQEIADRSDLPLGTVKTHARRGLLRMRAWFTETKDEVSA